MRLSLSLLLAAILTAATAQVDLERTTDEAIGVQDSDVNYEDQLENLTLLVSNPLNLNKVSADELRMLNLLTELQIQRFLEYRSDVGELLSIYELQAVPDFDLSTIKSLTNYVSVRDPNSTISASVLRRQVSEGNHYLILRHEITLEKKQGFDSMDKDAAFIGKPGKTYMRIRSSKPGRYSFGLTAENDEGEEFAWSPTNHHYAFDFTSIHARFENRGIIKNLILGDFTGQFGQGLTLGGGFGYGKGSEAVLGARRCQLGFIPYTSSNESLFFRGGAITTELTRNISLSLGLSSLYQDANISTDTLESTVATSTIITSGLHRNRNELESKDSNRELNQIIGLNYNNNTFNAGIIALRTLFSDNIDRKPQPYNQFSFRGNQNTNVGIYFNWSKNNALFFGEASQTIEQGHAFITGVLLSLTSKLDMAMVHRGYSRDFVSFYANALSENTSPQNESGTYWGWKYNVNRKLSTSGYIDLFKFPWLRFRAYRPSLGHEWLVAASFNPSKQSMLKIQYREESKERNLSKEQSAIYHAGVGTKRNYLMSLSVASMKKVRFSTRVQGSTFHHDGKTSSGIAMFEDISLDMGRVVLSLRHALFQTDDYDNRQYAYEKDVWLAFTLPAVAGTGIRNYGMLQYDINKALSIWIKYTRVRYLDREIIGSGVDSIHSSSKNDLKFQLRIKL